MIRRRQDQLSIDDLLAFGPHRSARELLSPRMRSIDEALDDPDLVDDAYGILAERRPESRTNGRPGTPAETVVRLLVLKHLKNWSYEELEWEVRGSLGYRYFCPSSSACSSRRRRSSGAENRIGQPSLESSSKSRRRKAVW